MHASALPVAFIGIHRAITGDPVLSPLSSFRIEMIKALSRVSELTGPILNKEAAIKGKLNVTFADAVAAFPIKYIPIAEPEVECPVPGVMQARSNGSGSLFQDLLELRLFPQGGKVRVFGRSEERRVGKE